MVKTTMKPASEHVDHRPKTTQRYLETASFGTPCERAARLVFN